MRYRIFCGLGTVASAAAIWGIAQFKYPSGAAHFFVSLAVSLIGLAGVFALLAALIGPLNKDK